MGSKYKQSPIGTGRHCWVNRPDIKYNADGLYHAELVVGGEEAQTYKAEIDAEVERAYAEEVESNGLKPAEAKKWSKYFPYTVEEDDQGAPTGNVIFKYKQNAKIKLKDGSVKSFEIGIRDAKNQPSTANVFGGCTMRVLYSARNVKLATAKQFGVRLDFSMVQLIKPAPMSGGGFDEVDGGYTEEAGETTTKEPQADY